ncbi:MAG: fibronectin type III domain-containing protein [Candidatus Kapaibacteriota bacterium]
MTVYQQKLFSLFFAILLGISLISCDMGNSPAINVPQPASELRATSYGPNAIRLAWKPSRTTVIGYDVQVMDEFRSIQKTVQVGRDSTAIIRDLQEGKVYTFRVFARSQDTISKGIEFSWAPATRFSGRLYVGLNKQNGINFLEERSYSIDKASSWDICLEVDSSVNPISYTISTPLASSIADVNGLVLNGLDKGKRVRKTELFNDISDPFIYTGIDSLHHLTFNAPIGAGYTPLQNLASNIQAFTRGFVLILRTQQNHHVQFHVKEKNLQIIQRDASGTFLEFEASIQRIPNLAYGKITH